MLGTDNVKFSDTNAWNSEVDPSGLVADLSDTNDQPIVFLTKTDADGNFEFSGSNVSVWQYEVAENSGAGWYDEDVNEWAPSLDFSVESTGRVVYDEDTRNGVFSDGDVVLLAIQATDDAGIKSDFFLMDITFEA